MKSKTSWSGPMTLSEAYEFLQKMRSAANDDQEALDTPTEEVSRRSGDVPMRKGGVGESADGASSR